MEAFTGLICVIAVIAALIFFKKTITKSAKYTEDVVTTNVLEAQVELYERSTEAYNEMIARLGNDFKTPEQLYRLTQRRRQMQLNPQNKQNP